MRSISNILITITLFLLLLSQGCGPFHIGRQSSITLPFEVDDTWPQKPDHFTWAQMPGVAIDHQDHIYIFTRSDPAVQVYQIDGTLLRAWNVEDANGAHFIRIGPAGNIWTANIRSHTIRKYSPEGELLLTLGEPGQAGADRNHFDKPTDMAILPSGDIFVSDGYGNQRIIHFDATGKYMNQWGRAGTEPGQFALPHAIVADSRGRLYVADRENARIQVFDTKGKLLAVWDNLITPWGLWISEDDDIWVCGSSARKKEGTDEWEVLPPPDQVVMKLNRKGKVIVRVPLTMTTISPGKPGELNWVHGIAFDSQGNLYLTDIQGHRAQKFVCQP
ncbi:peptidyl-alpha-hydroxyglycine alpha-amidating lyase family protein [Planctomycetota bacterium]